MSLQGRLGSFKVDFEAGKPPYNVPHLVVETLHRARPAPPRPARSASPRDISYLISTNPIATQGAAIQGKHEPAWSQWDDAALNVQHVEIYEIQDRRF
jgi:hypothetical protein